MKKSAFTVFTLLSFISIASANPDKKLILLFNQSFPSAENVRWHDEKDAHVVFFKAGKITNRITYNLNDEFVRGERYYDENILPVYILFAIRKKYKKEQIFGVTELTDQSSIYYHIVLKMIPPFVSSMCLWMVLLN